MLVSAALTVHGQIKWETQTKWTLSLKPKAAFSVESLLISKGLSLYIQSHINVLQYKHTAFQCRNSNLCLYTSTVYVMLCTRRQRWERGCCVLVIPLGHQCQGHTFSKCTNLWPSHWLFVITKTPSSSCCGCSTGRPTQLGVWLCFTNPNTALLLLLALLWGSFSPVTRV